MVKKYLWLGLALLLFVGLGFSTRGAKEEKSFDIYTDKVSTTNHFIPSGWMGDVGDLKFDDQHMDNPASGASCIKITYTAQKSNGAGWAGIYWQSSENNWGTQDTGYDLTGFNKLVFKARGEKGGEVISKIVVGGIIRDKSTGKPLPYPDSLEVNMGPIRLTKDWKEYSVNLVDKDLSYVNGGLAVVFSSEHITQEQNIYLDEIKFVYDSTLTKEENKVNFPFYVYADYGSLDNHYTPSGWMPASSGSDLTFEPACKESYYSGETSIKITYKDNSGTGWAGIYWQNPPDNWGKIPGGGINLVGAKKLTFWARGEKGGEIIDKFQIGGINGGPYMDSDVATIGPVKLNKEWTKYEISLQGKDLSYISGGFCFAVNSRVNKGEPVTFYIDEIRYEKE